MTTPHKHADILRALADGHEIEWKCDYDDTWHELGSAVMICELFIGQSATIFRIKPEKKWYRVAKLIKGPIEWTENSDNEAEEAMTMNSVFFQRWLSDRIYYE